MADYEGVLSNESREFWREQLLSNRVAAAAALEKLAGAAGGRASEPGAGAEPRGPRGQPAVVRAVATL